MLLYVPQVMLVVFSKNIQGSTNLLCESIFFTSELSVNLINFGVGQGGQKTLEGVHTYPILESPKSNC
jgi:hypothetical protein